MKTINFFKFPNGKCPVKEFLDSLNSQQVQKVLWVMQLIEEIEGHIPSHYFKKLVNADDIPKFLQNAIFFLRLNAILP